jgi:hypothetical protein
VVAQWVWQGSVALRTVHHNQSLRSAAISSRMGRALPTAGGLPLKDTASHSFVVAIVSHCLLALGLHSIAFDPGPCCGYNSAQ